MVRHLLSIIAKTTRKVRRGCAVDQSQHLSKKWYVVVTKPRSEEIAKFHLNLRNINVFYPKLFVPVATRPSGHVVSLFPNYLFVKIDLSSTEYCQVVWCRGVKKIVSFGGEPSAVENNVVDFIREQADPSGLIIAKSNLKFGDEVHIAKGPFKGLVGIIQEPPDTKSRVRVLMSILSRHVPVEVPAGYIDMGWVAPCPSV